MLRKMDRESGDMFFRQASETVALRLALDELGEIKPIFANDVKNLITAGGKFASLPRY
jgi:hypothetical protein